MYTQRKNKPTTTSIKRNTSYVGETIEHKINRIVNNKEPIKDGAPIIYTDRKDGVQPQYDVRTDRFELAVMATDHIHQQHLAKRKAPGENKAAPDLGAEAAKGMKAEGQTPPTTTASN